MLARSSADKKPTTLKKVGLKEIRFVRVNRGRMVRYMVPGGISAPSRGAPRGRRNAPYNQPPGDARKPALGPQYVFRTYSEA